MVKLTPWTLWKLFDGDEPEAWARFDEYGNPFAIVCCTDTGYFLWQVTTSIIDAIEFGTPSKLEQGYESTKESAMEKADYFAKEMGYIWE